MGNCCSGSDSHKYIEQNKTEDGEQPLLNEKDHKDENCKDKKHKKDKKTKRRIRIRTTRRDMIIILIRIME